MSNLSGVDPSILIQFRNCFLLRDHAIIREDLWVRNKKIVDPEPIFFTEKVSSNIQVDCKNSVITPGFIDLQINGGFGTDFSHDDGSVEEGVSKVALNILAHGVTSFCPTVISSPKEKYQRILPRIRKSQGGKDGAGILGVHLEGPFISREKKGAHSVQFIRTLEGGLADLKSVYGDLKDVSIVTLAPELDPQSSVIHELSKEGIAVALGHSVGNLADGEKAINAGASLITHLFNAMLPFHHRDPGLVGLLSSQSIVPKKTVYYGIIADGIHTHPAALRIAHKANPLGLVLVTDAISAMGLQEGRHYIGDQQVDIRGGKAFLVGTDTLCGSIATMDSCVRFFQKATGCSSVDALECATLHPAQALQIVASKGTLDYGTDADFVFLDEQLHVQATYIAGQCVWDRNNE